MDYVESLRTFIAIADAGSLVGGARQRRISAPSATRMLAGLEAHLGATLVVRTTRTLRLTEVGAQFLADTRAVVAALERAEETVTGRRVRPEGTLAITAPELFGQRHIAPLVFEFLDLHPQVKARALFTNRVVHLIDEGFDVALRIGALPDSGLTAVPVGALRVVLVASPAYLARHGTPRTPDELAAHHAVSLSIEGQAPVTWGFRGARRKAAAAAERLIVNSNSVKVAAAVAGQGIARAIAYQVVDEVRDGRLRLLLPTYEPPPIPVHFVHPEGRSAAAKVREFLRLAVPRLQAMPLLRGDGLTPPRRARDRAAHT